MGPGVHGETRRQGRLVKAGSGGERSAEVVGSKSEENLGGRLRKRACWGRLRTAATCPQGLHEGRGWFLSRGYRL